MLHEKGERLNKEFRDRRGVCVVVVELESSHKRYVRAVVASRQRGNNTFRTLRHKPLGIPQVTRVKSILKQTHFIEYDAVV